MPTYYAIAVGTGRPIGFGAVAAKRRYGNGSASVTTANLRRGAALWHSRP
jgi:hypothetical protein